MSGASQSDEGRGDADRWLTIDHVQLAIPPGGEAVARTFFVDRLGFVEQPKPTTTARWDDELPGVHWCHIDDPFGNRIELIDAG